MSKMIGIGAFLGCSVYRRTVIVKCCIVFAFFAIFVVNVAGYSDVKISKCCPQNSMLVVIKNSQFKDKFECQPVSEPTEFIGFNLKISLNQSMIPECSDVEFFEFDHDGGLISSDGCVDLVGGVLYGLKCSDRLQVEVHKVHKCCSIGYSYDMTERRCVPNVNDAELIVDFFRNSVAVFQIKSPNCSDDLVFVEYRSNLHNLWLSRSGVKVAQQDGGLDYLRPDSFCVEGIYEENKSGVDETSLVAVTRKSKWLIRTCRPVNVCEQMPCVRRCCRNEQMIERQNGTSVCVQHSRNIKPVFHDVNLPLSADKSQTVVEPPGNQCRWIMFMKL